LISLCQGKSFDFPMSRKIFSKRGQGWIRTTDQKNKIYFFSRRVFLFLLRIYYHRIQSKSREKGEKGEKGENHDTNRVFILPPKILRR